MTADCNRKGGIGEAASKTLFRQDEWSACSTTVKEGNIAMALIAKNHNGGGAPSLTVGLRTQAHSRKYK